MLIRDEANGEKARDSQYMNDKRNMTSDVLSERRHKLMPDPLGL